MSDTTDKIKTDAGDAYEKAKEAAGQVGDKAKDLAETGYVQATEVARATSEAVRKIVNKAAGQVEEKTE